MSECALVWMFLCLREGAGRGVRASHPRREGSVMKEVASFSLSLRALVLCLPPHSLHCTCTHLTQQHTAHNHGQEARNTQPVRDTRGREVFLARRCPRADSPRRPRQAEFSPPLDTSLIAALVADYVDQDDLPTDEILQTLRGMLSELATRADEDETLVSGFNDLRISPTEDTSADTHDLFSSSENASSAPNTAATSNFSSESDSSAQPFSSPLGFLQAAFPHLPTSRLRSALGSPEDVNEIDMEDVVGNILSQEYVKELEERGPEDDVPESNEPWQTVPKVKAKAKKKKAGQTITLVDIRQQQHAPRPSSTPSTPTVPLDPWTQVSSVATRLSDLLPSHSAAYFQSRFHAPNFSSPAAALRSGLATMKVPSRSSDPDGMLEMEMKFNIFDMLTAADSASSMTDSEIEDLKADIQLCVSAALASRSSTDGAAEAALDLVSLLRELDTGRIEWGVYHTPSTPSTPQFPSGSGAARLARRSTLPAGPPSPPQTLPRKSLPSAASGSASPVSDAWQTIPVIPRGSVLSPHADFIPAYNPTAKIGKGRPARKPPKTVEKKLDVLDPHWHRRRANELLEKRKEALLEASRMWQRSTVKNRGGEAALIFAERVSIRHLPLYVD